jgi:hypothetical protein
MMFLLEKIHNNRSRAIRHSCPEQGIASAMKRVDDGDYGAETALA